MVRSWGLNLRLLCCAPPTSEIALELTAREQEKDRSARLAAEEAQAAAQDEARGHYSVLGLPVDFTAAELKKAYRKLSLTFHPDRVGGSTAKMVRITVAYDCLSDAACKRDFDAGVGLDDWDPDAVEKHYFPERFPFEPFGDPFQYDRDPARRERAAARRTERMWTPPAAGPMVSEPPEEQGGAGDEPKDEL